MKPTWLVEKDIFLDTEINLIETLKEKGYPVNTVQYIPFDDDLSRFEKITEKNVIYYGSLNLAIKLKDKFNWIPGVYGDIKKYNCSSYYPYFKDYLLNKDYLYMTYADLYQNRDYLFEKFNDIFFVRPDSILKEFTGQPISKYNFEDAYKLLGFYNDVVTQNLPIYVSSLKDIQKEWRFIVADNEIITGSLYRVKEKEETLHELCTDDNALNFAKQMAKLYNPERVWVLDVCLSNNQYKLLEIGCFSFAGLYGNDLNIIVDKVSEIAKQEYNER